MQKISQIKGDKKFINEKNQCLRKKDKSRKSSIDKPILRLVNLINRCSDYYTTSSCSGRIVLIEMGSGKKQESRWILIKHGKVSSRLISKALDEESSGNDIWLKLEPFIIHVCCKDLESAKTLLTELRDSGVKRAGIISLNSRIMIEAIGNERIDTLVSRNKKILINGESLRVLIDEADDKLQRNNQKIRELEHMIADILSKKG